MRFFIKMNSGNVSCFHRYSYDLKYLHLLYKQQKLKQCKNTIIASCFKTV